MSDDKNLYTQGPNSKSTQLHNSGLRAGSLIDQSLARLNKEQAENIMSKAAEAALELELKKRTQDIDYDFGKKAAEDHIDTFSMLEKGGRTTRQHVVSDIKTGGGKMRIESKSGASCFVASVAYADPNHPDVMFLRAYRDEVLSKSTIGRSFVDWYWKNGPKLARIVEKSDWLRNASRYLISKIVIHLKSHWQHQNDGARRYD